MYNGTKALKGGIMEFIEILRLLEKSSLFSGLMGSLIGAIVGGLITWIVTSKSLNKQFEYQKQIAKEETMKEEKRALKSVKNEITHNLIYLNGIRKSMNECDMDFVDYKKSESDIMLKNDKWEKYGDIIEGMLYLV